MCAGTVASGPRRACFKRRPGVSLAIGEGYMTRFVRVASMCCLLAAGCFGQRMGGGGFRGGGFGRVSGGFIGAPRGFGYGFGGFGGRAFIGRRPFFHRPFYPFFRSRFFYPGAFPVSYGGFGYGGFGYGGGFYDPPYYPPPYYGPASAPNVTIIYMPPVPHPAPLQRAPSGRPYPFGWRRNRTLRL
jgi:hypothetical protein